MFPDLKQDGKKPVLNGGTDSGLDEDVPECSGCYFSQIFTGKIRFPGNGIRECRFLGAGGQKYTKIALHNLGTALREHS